LLWGEPGRGGLAVGARRLACLAGLGWLAWLARLAVGALLPSCRPFRRQRLLPASTFGHGIADGWPGLRGWRSALYFHLVGHSAGSDYFRRLLSAMR